MPYQKKKKPTKQKRLLSYLDLFQKTNIHLTHKFLQNFIVCFPEGGGGEQWSGMGWNSDRLKGKKDHFVAEISVKTVYYLTDPGSEEA